MTSRKVEFYSDPGLLKDTRYLILMGELEGIFCELFG